MESERVRRTAAAQEPPQAERHAAPARSSGRRSSPNQAGLPIGLQAAVEQLSGIAMDGVTVHRESSAPAALGALAFARGDEIQLAPGQEQHLPHEAWHVVQQAQGRVGRSAQSKRRGPIEDDRGLEREADVMGARAARLARRAVPTAPVPVARRPVASEPRVQLKAPAGWKDDDATTWEPDAYTSFDYSLVSDALSTLHLDTQRPLANKWAAKALASGLVGKGPVRSTYKSGYDQDADAFSVSQDVPDIDQLVVHAHISPTDVVALDGGVNLKWKHDEYGYKAANIPATIGAAIIDVPTARAHWESNPKHDEAELDAEERAIGQAIFDLFDTTKQDALDKAAAEKAKKESDTKLVNWGWANTVDKKKYGERLTTAKKDPEKFERFLQMVRNAQARHAAREAAKSSADADASST